MIGQLRRVPLREVWPHEARDFTIWLQENIDILNTELGIGLIGAEREQAAGSFSVDLVAEDEHGNTVVIENQLERSDHDHLGKLLTYMTAMDAKAAIWIVADPRPEHVAVISWLNESFSVDFYLLKVEAVRIGDSPAAPLLTEIVGPSAETKSVGVQKKELSERHLLRSKWWDQLIGHPDTHTHAHLRGGPDSWIGVSAGIRGLNYNYVVHQQQSAAELYIDCGADTDEETAELFAYFYSAKEEIEATIPFNVDWDRRAGRRAHRIRIVSPGGYRLSKEEWHAAHTEVIKRMNVLQSALAGKIENLKHSSY